MGEFLIVACSPPPPRTPATPARQPRRRRTRIRSQSFAVSGKNFVAHPRPLPLPLIILPQFRLVLLHLRFQFAKRLLAASAHICTCPDCMQSPRGQRQIQRAGVLIRSQIFCKGAVQLHQVRRVTLQQFPQFSNVSLNFRFHRLLSLDVFITYGKFHACTCSAFRRRAAWRARIRSSIHITESITAPLLPRNVAPDSVVGPFKF